MTDLREFTPEQQAAINELARLRFERDERMACRNTSPPPSPGEPMPLPCTEQGVGVYYLESV